MQFGTATVCFMTKTAALRGRCDKANVDGALSECCTILWGLSAESIWSVIGMLHSVVGLVGRMYMERYRNVAQCCGASRQNVYGALSERCTVLWGLSAECIWSVIGMLHSVVGLVGRMYMERYQNVAQCCVACRPNVYGALSECCTVLCGLSAECIWSVIRILHGIVGLVGRMYMERYRNIAQYLVAYLPNGIPTNLQKYPLNTAIYCLCFRHKHAISAAPWLAVAPTTSGPH
jgi:hypothetical protein